jgi:hypothetical protein
MRGFGEATSMNWEAAVPFIERFIKYNPSAGFGYRFMAMLYAQVDREQEAQVMFDKGFKGWPPALKTVRYLLTNFSQKNHRVTERFAEGFIKAGLSGEPSDFYKIFSENRLTGEDIRELLTESNGGSNVARKGRRPFVKATNPTQARVGLKRICSAINGTIFMRT